MLDIYINGEMYTPKKEADKKIRQLEAKRDALQAKLDESVNRIKDILLFDDGQAYKEAERFLNNPAYTYLGKGDA